MYRDVADGRANLYAQEPQSIEKSQTIVYINGAKYYVHNVRHGETLYSLAKTYGVAEQVIAAENPQLAQGLKADQSLKIPVVETVSSYRSSFLLKS